MEYTVYTFGGGEILNGVFNAIAMSLNGHDGSLLEPLKRLGLVLGTFWAAIYVLYGDYIKVFTHWIVPMTVFMNLLFVPTATIWIHDPVHHYHQKVDHVPYGLAALAGYVSTLGYQLTSKIESFFSLPDDLRYQKSGFLFASDILQKAKTFHITNSDLAENMKSFVGQCVLYDAMLGRKYTIDDLRNADDIWGLVSDHPSPARSFVWRDLKLPGQPRGRPHIIACSEGVTKFNQLWASEITHAANLFGKKIFDKAGVINPRAELLKYLPLAYGQLGHIAKDASEIIKQQMMIYSIVDGVESNSTALGNAPNFAARRAYLQQRSTYETLGAMAGETLPVMKAVLEAIIYAFFLFVIPLVLLPFGYRFLLTWAQSILWLQLWAPLYAVLNYIMTITATSKTMAALAISNSQGVTIASSVGIANVNADITAMAGYLSLSIPFLSIALVKGVGSFVHLASHLGNVAQSTAAMAANEVTSGNLSYGNLSLGNQQILNSNMLHHAMAASYKAASIHLQDGRSEITTMADGSQVLNVGSSNLPVSLNVAESQSAQLTQMASQSQQNALNHSESSSQNLSSSYRNMMDLSQTLAQSQHHSDSVRQGVSTEQSQALQKGSQLINDFAKQNNTQEQKAADFLAEASIGIGLGKNAVSAAYKTNLSASDQELYQKAEKYVQDQNFQEAMRQATQVSKDIAHTATDENTKRSATTISGAYEQAMSQRHEAAKSFRQAEDYTNQANFTRANSATINYNANQQFGEWLAKQPADNTKGQIGVHGAMHIMAANPNQTMAYAEKFMTEQGMMPTNTIASEDQLKSRYDQEQRHQVRVVTADALTTVTQAADDMGIVRHVQVANDVSGNANRETITTPMISQAIATHPKEPMQSSIQQIEKNNLDSGVNPVALEKSNPNSGIIAATITAHNHDYQPQKSPDYAARPITGDLTSGSRTLASSEQAQVNEHQARTIARDFHNATPQDSVGYTAQPMAGDLTPDSRTLADSKQAQVNNHQVEAHQEHTIARDFYNDIAKAVDNVETNIGSQTISNQVDSTITANRTEIEAKAQQVQSQGEAITNKVKKHQHKGVNYRVVARGAKEVGNIGKDIKNIKFGENQQK